MRKRFAAGVVVVVTTTILSWAQAVVPAEGDDFMSKSYDESLVLLRVGCPASHSLRRKHGECDHHIQGDGQLKVAPASTFGGGI